ncbi:erythromycin esterase family protein [Streptomyces sp. NPDC016845]|uniref:erythromycin esterase family protein n=1 Tax=Streptomyces sp. NPDC016845 TaxID=3364972 RepID=UPI0037A3E744
MTDTTAHAAVPRRRLLQLAAAGATVTTLLPLTAGPAGAAPPGDPVDALAQHAVPLAGPAGLDAVARMAGSARVVGLGEAAHSGHEFFVLKTRLFKKLVADRGFTTFVLEASWSTGLRLDDYVAHGTGDPARIMREEFQGQYVFWNTEEYLDLIHWMRHYNRTHPDRPRLRFVGNDLGYAGAHAYDLIHDWCAAHRPDLTARLDALYAPLRPAAGTEAGAWMGRQLSKDPATRQAEADRSVRALALISSCRRPRGQAGRAQDLALRTATALTQTFTAYAFPDDRFADRMRYRDQVMADNTAWWLDHSRGKLLLASNNGHVAYTSDNPVEFPEPAGAFLRRRLGTDYVNIGLTFGAGRINALPDFTATQPRTYTVKSAPAGHNEHTLDQVAAQDFALDLRTAPPAARTWSTTARPTRSYGLYWSGKHPRTSLAHSYDIVVHLHRVKPGALRRTP